MDKEMIEITSNVINHQIDTVTSRLSGEVKAFWLKHIASFTKYIENANKRYESTKTLLYKDQPVLLKDIYVGTNLIKERKSVSDIEFLDELKKGNRCIVSATAGAGKSFFSKWIFLQILSSKNSIPLFIELRNLNYSDSGIIDYIVNDLKTNFKVSILKDVLIQLIENGKFTLILDGYDELTNNKAKAINNELLSLEVPFSESSILITTRPGSEDLEYLSGFTIYKVQPLNINQAVSLIEKLKYDETVKKSFLEKLASELFEKHKDFLSNPLLLTIMLITYSDLAEIPSKMHIFYEQAFDTLFYRHDSSKGMYRRELKSHLAIDDFKNILSCLSASSYIRGQITLTNTDLVSFIRKGKQTANINKLNPKDYIYDLVQSVCVLLEDGTRYTYNHRSFQEYFAALFLTQIPTERKIDVYKKFLEREGTDKALTLAFEMNQSMVEREFIRPMLESLLQEAYCPDSLIQVLMSGITLERRISKHGNGIVKRHKPRYNLVEPTAYWFFLDYIESMYKKETKKFLKFGVMTIKSFVAEFGNGEIYERIMFKDEMTAKSQSTLRKIGVMEITKRRLEFVKWLKNDIEARDNRTGDHNLEAWL